MKKILCLVLAAIMICGIFTSCSTLEDNDKGAIVTMYLANQMYDFDPMSGYDDTATARVLSLVFEGLTTLDEDGDWHYGMMDSYEFFEPDEKNDFYRLIIELDSSKWSDGRTVQANDFVYAWKRIMEPTNACEAAALLYDIRNAYDVKMGDATVDDLGVYAVETYTLEVDFDKEIDTDEFFKKCASVALVPLREDKVGTDPDWAKRASTMVTNGPFDIRRITYGEQLSLERSSYYRRDTDSNEALDKYVIPYRLVIYYQYGDNEKQYDRFVNGDLFYLSELALSVREDEKDDAEVLDTAITASMYFNTENRYFKDPDVRRALSLAIDRDAIAKALVFADPATGFIPGGVDDADSEGDFREEADDNGKLLEGSAKVDEAKKLLSSAGVSSGSFSITVRDNEADKKIAEMVAENWNALGFKVEVKALGAKAKENTVANQSVIYEDLFRTAYTERDFDVIMVDYNMLAPDAFSALAPFALTFSGNGVDMYSESYDPIGHITGYNSEEYNKLIEDAYKENDSEKKTEILHSAEELLLKDSPIAPVVFLKDAYIYSDELSGIGNTYWGRDFKKMKMDDYMDYKESIQAANTEDQAADN